MQRLPILLSLICCVSTLSAETFPNPKVIPGPTSGIGVYVADLNNDGRPDIYYSSLDRASLDSPDSIYVFLAKADGNYESLAPYVLPTKTLGDCWAADVNHDHNLDLVCTTVNSDGSSSFSAETLLGKGDGTFQPAIASVLGVGQGFLPKGSADFNNDGNFDLAVETLVGGGTGGAALLLGDGTGRFSKRAVTGVDPYLYFAVADVNSDGKADILGSTGPQSLLGNGDGSFVQVPVPGPPIPGGLCSFADMDGDNRLDALCSKIDGTSTFEILRGKGDGSFDIDQPVIVPLPEASDFGFPLKAFDFNHDGIMDILSNASTGPAVLLGKGDLQFSNPTHYNVTGNNYLVHHGYDVADLDGDGNLDFVAAGIDGLYITYGRGDGTFGAVTNFTIGQQDVSDGRAADFNNDGIADLLTEGGSALYLSLGRHNDLPGDAVAIPNGEITFTAASPFAVGDFNGDGKQDILASGSADQTASKLYFMGGKGDGSFAAPLAVPGQAVGLSTRTSVADVNNDGRSDLLDTGLSSGTSPSYISAQIAQSDGSFSSPVKSFLPASYSATWVALYAVADFNQDGKPDVVVGADALYRLPGKGDGSFASTGESIPIPGVEPYSFPRDMKTGDFDGDGNPDLAVLIGNPPASQIVVFYGDGSGGFSAPVTVDTPHHLYSTLRVADLDGDGRSDLIVELEDPIGFYFGITTFHALDHRSFGPKTNYVAGLNGAGLLFPADFDGDGFPELLSGYRGHTFTLLKNDPGPIVTRQLTVQPEPSVVGEPIRLVAKLGPPAGSTVLPTGTVTFSIDHATAGNAVLSDGTATLGFSSKISLGAHRISAYWPGDSNYPSVIFSTQHAVTLIPVAIGLKTDPNPVTVGQKIDVSFSFANTVLDHDLPTPTGTYTVLDGSTAIGNGTVSAATSSYGVSGIYLPAGTHTLTVNYGGDTNHSAATSNISEVINPAPSTISLQISPSSPSRFGQPMVVTAAVQPGVGEGVPSLPSSVASTVTFYGLPGVPMTVPLTFPAGSPANTPGVASFTTTGAVAPGSYSVTAMFSGNSNLLSSTSTGITQVVSPPPSTTSIKVDPVPAYQSHPVVITAFVSGSLALPTGMVSFLDGNTILATSALVNGRAVFSTSDLTVGSHNITAAYGGDQKNAPSNSVAVSETIQPYDFSMTTAPGDVVVARGEGTALSFTLAGVGDFSEDLTMTVTNVPDSFSATLSPATLHLDPGGSAKVTLNLVPNRVSAGKGLFHQNGGTISVASLLFSLAIFRRRRLAACICALFLVSIAGCGGQSSTPSRTTYKVQIMATAKDTLISHGITIPVTMEE